MTWRERWYRVLLSHAFGLGLLGAVFLLTWAIGVDLGGWFFWLLIAPLAALTLFGFAYDVVLILKGKNPREIRAQAAKLMAEAASSRREEKAV
jgi:hypothetical protein